jgi:arylsulfatase A-like enzyme
MHVSKWYPYDEAVKVPLVFAWPGQVAAGHKDAEHLVSGLDVMSTLCDYAAIKPPAGVRGRSLRPLLAGKNVTWREFVASEHHVTGRMIRTGRYKYVRYEDDPVEQLFDMKADPWETKNLYEDPQLATVLADHRKLLKDWRAHLKPVPPTPGPKRRPRRRPARKPPG